MAHGVLGWWFETQPMDCLCCLHTFEAGVVVGPRGAGLMILSQPMGCLCCFVHGLVKKLLKIIGGEEWTLAHGGAQLMVFGHNPWTVFVVVHTFQPNMQQTVGG